MVTKGRKQDPRLKKLIECVSELEDAIVEPMGAHAAFSVRKKNFAYFLNDHHGDGIVSIACKVVKGDHVTLAQAQPDRFYLPAYIGPRGWVALRLDRGAVDWDEVRELLFGSYILTAPKALAARAQAKLE